MGGLIGRGRYVKFLPNRVSVPTTWTDAERRLLEGTSLHVVWVLASCNRLVSNVSGNRRSKPSFKSLRKSSSTSNPPLPTSNGVRTPGGMSGHLPSPTGCTWIPCSAPAYYNSRDSASEWRRFSTLRTTLETQTRGIVSILTATLYCSLGERTKLRCRRARK